jgi:hypothetical protein|tara:strand:+ start:577 stop:867 length:291 start_codon:yes stop_codon:yes gene_type:complete
MKESITLKTHNAIGDEPIYLCDWNDGEIVQIHSKETLEKEYAETNLFDDDGERFSTFSNGFKYHAFTIQDYLKESEDLDYYNIRFRADNMTITRIA